MVVQSGDEHVQLAAFEDVLKQVLTNAVAWGGAGGARAPLIKISRRSIPPDSLKLRDFGARGGPPQ